MQVYVSNREIEQIAEGLVEVSCGKPPPKCIDIWSNSCSGRKNDAGAVL